MPGFVQLDFASDEFSALSTERDKSNGGKKQSQTMPEESGGTIPGSPEWENAT